MCVFVVHGLSGLRVKECVVCLLGFKRPNLGFHTAHVEPVIQAEIAVQQSQISAQTRHEQLMM